MWPFLRPNDKGHTMPNTTNCPAWRPDRILLRKSKNWMPLNIRIIGDEPLLMYCGTDK